MFNKFGLTSAAYMLLLAGALSACSSPKPATYQLEKFDSSASPYAHSFSGTAAETCNAARRALLSQGYTTTSSNADAVDGSKNFQPDKESHVVIEFHVVCTSDFPAARTSMVYVNALQDRYTLKKSTTSASVGLSVLGAISLPIGSSDDALVKTSSETIPSGPFYDRYFGLVQHYLNIRPEKEPIPAPDSRLLEMVPISKTTGTIKDGPAAAAAAAASGASAAAAMPASAPAAASAASAASAPSSSATSVPAPPVLPTAPDATPASAASPAAAPAPAPAPAPASAPSPASAPATSPTSANSAPAIATSATPPTSANPAPVIAAPTAAAAASSAAAVEAVAPASAAAGQSAVSSN